MNFANKVVVITGASSGIGAATAIHFANLCANVVISGRNVKNLKEVADKCRKENPILIVPGDVTKPADNEKLMSVTLAQYGKLDVLVNNAGIMETGTIENTSLEQFDRVMNTNLRSIYHLTMLAVPHLVKTKGNIVSVSSVNGIRSFPGLLAYNISKSGVDQFTRCVALELGPKGVRCNSVNPGVIITNLQKRGGMDEKTYQEFLKRSQTTHALCRAGNANEVADAIAFLASDMATFITGVSLLVDGGRHAMCPR